MTQDEEEFDPELVDVSVRIEREGQDGYNALRSLWVEITYDDDDADGPKPIGGMNGWITLNPDSPDLADAGDCVGHDAMVLTAAAAAISQKHSRYWLGLLIDRFWLDETWRGRRLTGRIVDQVLDLLQRDRDEAVVVLVPEPQQLGGGGPYPDGPERDQAKARLEAAYKTAGFRRWKKSSVWWLAK
ncbi:hypothetical protein C8046_16755 [Serinibacter arcticus]|uniref:N-acetyltransferase domain-containing protein n=1 Tax=Serinibacter arcticus TaxID=1655435 RepID=A0A2U1ZYI7_9MICO|nr:hypothetical protein [Serinibacter arcticus]PWD52049.1 hypothetical protein C8046_16755 [Serinibacter arcticus]